MNKYQDIVPKNPNKTENFNISDIFFPKTTTGKLIKSAVQVIDPLGFSSYPDVWESAKEAYADPSLSNIGGLVLDVAGALPVIGKIPKSIRLLKNTSKLVKAKNQVQAVNRTIDMIPDLIPGVKKLSNATKKFTSKYLTTPVYNSLLNGKSPYYKAPEYADIAVDLINGVNTIDDLSTFGQSVYNKYKEE